MGWPHCVIMIMFASATTFHVADVEASLSYYISVLGFYERFRYGEYAGVENGTVQIHLAGPGATNKRDAGQSGVYIFVDECDAYYAEITAKGAKTQTPPQDQEYGMRDFIIEDLDGNLIGIGKKLRMKAQPTLGSSSTRS